MAEKWDSATIARAVSAIAQDAELSGTDPEAILTGVSTGLSLLLARIEPESARDDYVNAIAAALSDSVRAVRRIAIGLPADPATNDNLH